MKPKLLLIVALLGILVVMVLNACVHELPVPPDGTGGGGGGGTTVTPPVTPSCSADTVYFQNSVLPLLNSSCGMSGCHDATSHKSGITLTSYATIIQAGIKPGNPNGSKIYTILSGTGGDRMPPAPAAPFTQAQKDIISKWILQGALNNSCNACDTATFTFAGAVAPIMNTYCMGCHNPTSLGGGYDLSTYTGVKAVVASGRLMGSINHTSGYSAMPLGGSQLSSCQVTQIQKWINAGALNN
jgi:hypothetical protein